MGKEENLGKCTNCGSSNYISDIDVDERVCAQCGLVLEEDTPDSEMEWVDCNDIKNNERSKTVMGGSVASYNKDFSTGFRGDYDGRGKLLNLKARTEASLVVLPAIASKSGSPGRPLSPVESSEVLAPWASVASPEVRRMPDSMPIPDATPLRKKPEAMGAPT